MNGKNSWEPFNALGAKLLLAKEADRASNMLSYFKGAFASTRAERLKFSGEYAMTLV